MGCGDGDQVEETSILGAHNRVGGGGGGGGECSGHITGEGAS